MGSGGTLAITPEPQTGGPGGKPSGPVIASGKITTI
jgi:anti-sigma-K factor RskA